MATFCQRRILLLICLPDMFLSQSRRENGDPISTVTMRIPCRRADAVLKVHAAYNANNKKALRTLGRMYQAPVLWLHQFYVITP